MKKDYQERLEAKKERYKQRSLSATKKSSDFQEEASKLSSLIPFGQPILVGHHSEGKHRNHIKKIDNKMRKSFEESSKAEYYQDKAEAVGTGGISQDDPEAVTKLKTKLEHEENSRDLMKDINKSLRKIWKKKNTPEENMEALLSWIYEGETSFNKDSLKAKVIQNTVHYPKNPFFPPYVFSNLSGRIKQIKERIDKLSVLHANAGKENETIIENDTIHAFINWDENRICIDFLGVKPEKEVRQLVKSNGFRWSPRNVVWQSYINNRQRERALDIAKELEA